MNKRQRKKRLKNETTLAKVNKILEAVRSSFHRETVLVVEQADKKLVERIKKHYEIADEYAEMRCYHEKQYLNRMIERLENIQIKLERQNREFIDSFILFTVINVALFIGRMLVGG